LVNKSLTALVFHLGEAGETGCLHRPRKQTSPVIIIFRIEHKALAVDDVPILCDRHIDGGPALSVDQFDACGSAGRWCL
jgi:hypothetical protein